jgi:adenosylhomocysteine nucleosidase
MRRWGWLLLVFGLMGCAPSPPPVLILAAFEVEIEPLLPHLRDLRTVDLAVGQARLATLDGQPVALVLTGAGLIDAAATAERAIVALRPSHVLMVGTAGSLDPALAVGAVLVPAAWRNHQRGSITPSGFRPSQTPPDAPADPALLLLAGQVVGVQVGGLGVSGDLFVADPATRASLFERTGARIVDMESAAVAQVSAAHGVPFVAVRAISDSADGAQADLSAGVASAAQAACDALRAILGAL